MASIRISIQGTSQLKQAMQTAPNQLRGAIRLSLTRSAVFTQGLFVRNMPKGVTGGLRRSTAFSFQGDTQVTIEPTEARADYVEFGTRPHMPPVDSLRAWAASKGLSPWGVARGIAKHGTPARPFLERTQAEAVPFIERDMDATIDKTIQDIL